MIERWADALRSLYLLRVPVASVLAFPLFSLLSLWLMETVFGNLLKGLTRFDCGVLAFTSYLAAIAAGFAGWIIEARGGERLAGSSGRLDLESLPRVGRIFRRLVPLAPLAVLAPAVLTSVDGRWLPALAALAGALAAVLLALFSWVLYYLLPRRLSFPDRAVRVAPGTLLHKAGLKATASMLDRGAPAPRFWGSGDLLPLDFLRQRLTRVREALERQLADLSSPFYVLPPMLVAAAVLLALSFLRWLILGLTVYLGPGYFADEEARRAREPYPEHVISLSFFLVIFAGYLGTGYLKMTRVGETTEFTTAAYLCISLTLLTTTLSGVTFALDRWPGAATVLTAVVVVLLVLVPAAGLTDHYFEPGEDLTGSFPPAAAAFEDGSARAVVVAAAGGGIQAAAWTATVLTGLERDLPGFRSSLAAVSGVSGGSVGAMYYLSSFPGPGLDESAAESIRQRAMASSLDEITAGLTFLEVLRIPLALWQRPRLLDRGLALELTFAARSGLGATTLADWAGETGPGRRPAVIFNSVEVETGRPVLFSTTRIEPPSGVSPAAAGGEGTAFRLGPGGIRIPTAVRLSASFPFVTPVARPVASGPATSGDRVHLADGGYYDNYGVTALAHWLNDALENSPSPPEKVLVLQIRSFPPAAREFSLRSFLFQVSAPLVTLLSVREEAQRIRNQEYLRVLQGYWSRSGRGVRIELATVDFLTDGVPHCSRQPPLSWRLREDQKECIAEVWKARRTMAIETVEEFLR